MHTALERLYIYFNQHLLHLVLCDKNVFAHIWCLCVCIVVVVCVVLSCVLCGLLQFVQLLCVVAAIVGKNEKNHTCLGLV